MLVHLWSVQFHWPSKVLLFSFVCTWLEKRLELMKPVINLCLIMLPYLVASLPYLALSKSSPNEVIYKCVFVQMAGPSPSKTYSKKRRKQGKKKMKTTAKTQCLFAA